ncbi:hypothetical protein [Burkholderia sp. SRS-W-2-2016]|nr:hypothetical protein [Burkholderia sp. SRS-W-2-2016]
MTYFMLGTPCPEADLMLFIEAEAVLDNGITAAERIRMWFAKNKIY